MSSPRLPHQRHGVSREEEKLWVGFYHRIHRDPALARELLALMKADAVMRREHLALYLCCRESLRIEQQRLWRDQQIAGVLRRIIVDPWRAFRRLWQRARAITVQCLPDSSRPPPSVTRSPPPRDVSPRPRKQALAKTRNGRALPTDKV